MCHQPESVGQNAGTHPTNNMSDTQRIPTVGSALRCTGLVANPRLCCTTPSRPAFCRVRLFLLVPAQPSCAVPTHTIPDTMSKKTPRKPRYPAHCPTVATRLQPATKEAVKQLAQKRGLTTSELIRRALHRDLAHAEQ